MLSKREGVDVLALDTNGGGAGGFEAGCARRAGPAMTGTGCSTTTPSPSPDCLEQLLAGVERAPSPPAVMTSVVRWKDGSLHPMNWPWLRLRHRGAFALGAGAGLAPIRAATFVSTMIHRDAVDRYGYPPGHYFIWSDDIEYTARILRDEVGFMVPDSVALHWTPQAHNTVNDDRGRFYFKVRNQLWLLRGDSFGGLERAQNARGLARSIINYVRRTTQRRRAVTVVLRGLRDGLDLSRDERRRPHRDRLGRGARAGRCRGGPARGCAGRTHRGGRAVRGTAHLAPGRPAEPAPGALEALLTHAPAPGASLAVDRQRHPHEELLGGFGDGSVEPARCRGRTAGTAAPSADHEPGRARGRARPATARCAALRPLHQAYEWTAHLSLSALVSWCRPASCRSTAPARGLEPIAMFRLVRSGAWRRTARYSSPFAWR